MRFVTDLDRDSGVREQRVYPIAATLNTKLQLYPEELIETLLHEMAHLMDPNAEDRHGPSWLALHRSYGGRGGRLHDFKALTPRRKLVGVCSKCGVELLRVRALSRENAYFHKGCGGIFDRRSE